MYLDSLKTARHIEEVMEHPNPMVMEAVKLYLDKQQMFDLQTFGSEFIKTYLDIEFQMHTYLERTRREEERNIPDTIIEDTIERASESPKFNIR